MDTKYTRLNQKLDKVINFQVTEADRFNQATNRWTGSDQFQQAVHDTRRKLLIGAGAVGGVGAVGAGGYGLYRRGVGMGNIPLPFSKGPRTKRGVISTPKSRGIMKNIFAGAMLRGKIR